MARRFPRLDLMAFKAAVSVTSAGPRLRPPNPGPSQGWTFASAPTAPPTDHLLFGEPLEQIAGGVMLAGAQALAADLARRALHIAEQRGDELLALATRARLAMNPHDAAADAAPEIYRQAMRANLLPLAGDAAQALTLYSAARFHGRGRECRGRAGTSQVSMFRHWPAPAALSHLLFVR